MFVERFMAWSVAVGIDQRSEAIGRLAQKYLNNQIAEDERDEALQVMTLYLDDPATKVRKSLAQVIAQSDRAPRTLLWSLAQDVAEVAAEIFQHSLKLRGSDLVAEINRDEALTQIAIAKRQSLDADTVRALVSKGCERAVVSLFDNDALILGPGLQHDIARRFGDSEVVRGYLLDQDDLAPATRQLLVESLSHSLVALALNNNWCDDSRMENLARDASNRVTVDIAHHANPSQMNDYVMHLRDTDQLTASVLVRACCLGNAAFFENALSILSGASLSRVQSIVDDGRIASFRSLYAKTGLPQGAYNVFKAAIEAWQTPRTNAEVLTDIIDRVENDPHTDGALFALLGRMAGELSRESAKTYERQLLLAA